MKTIPSLIASSTIGIAAAGLALGKQEFPQLHQPGNHLHDVNDDHDQSSSLPCRPASSFANFDNMNEHGYLSEFNHEIRNTSFSKPHRRPPLTHVNRSKYAFYQRPPSSLKIGRTSSHEVSQDEDRMRESISSRSSWLRRLSSRPTSHSQQGTTTPESPKTAPENNWQFSTSRRLKKSSESLPRNRLVKRIPRARAISGSETLSRSGKNYSLSQRPITSHRRKLLSQSQPEKFSGIIKDNHPSPLWKNCASESPHMWRQYFDSRTVLISKEQNSENASERHPKTSTTCNRVVMDDMGIPTLVTPSMIFKSKDYRHLGKKGLAKKGLAKNIDIVSSKKSFDDLNLSISASRTSSITEASSKIPHRSLSMHFTSPISRLSRPESLGGRRYKADGKIVERCASVLTSGTKDLNNVSANGLTADKISTFDQSYDHRNSRIDVNRSLLLPSLSRFSTLSVDMGRIGLSSSSSSSSSLSPLENSNTEAITKSCPLLNIKTTTISSSSTTYENSNEAPNFSVPNSRGNYLTFDIGDRASTLIGSDLDNKGFTSCDEDDTDFQSETVFDSMRSGATGMIQSTKPPIEFIFDDSPIFTDDNLQLYRRKDYCEPLDYAEFQPRFLLSEDEYTIISPKEDRLILKKHLDIPLVTSKKAINADKFLPHVSVICLAKNKKGYAFPMDTNNDSNNEDEDWTKDEILSKPGEKLKSRLDISLNKESRQTLYLDELHSQSEKLHNGKRPKANVFDWSEPLSPDKSDKRGNSPRPRTAHVKQLMDVRCGRVLGRRGPASLHIRSQSVPVAPDTDVAKISSKFGTWGLSSKAVREDWDGDFEFDNINPVDLTGEDSTIDNNGVQVPEAIKANQENIFGHVSQIREVCLLVEDLKRLRALGKAQGLLDGAYESLWLEAEGIIALAAPTEEGEEEAEKQEDRGKPQITSSLNTNNDSSLSIQSNDNELIKIDTESDVKLNDIEKIEDRKLRIISFCSGDENLQQTEGPSPPHNSTKNSIEVARKVMESIHQQRSASDPLLQKFAEGSGAKMPFDTTSLKDLVNRAAVLSRTLGQIVRTADGLELIPQTRSRNSSPAFTRMFTDPMSLPPKSSHDSMKVSNSNDLIDESPLQGLSQCMQLMTVN
ncbi:hypothetical protein HI914_02030 [Erysiphe necator]|nr:hypothetical protein HI914_02030 [Erysiphe necator]